MWGPRRYVKVDVAVLGSSSPYGLCGRKATLNSLCGRKATLNSLCGRKATLNSNETSLRAAQELRGSRGGCSGPNSAHGLCTDVVVVVECCFTSTETIGLLWTGAQDGHLDFHTAPEL